jgi:hypothetical protein
MGNRIHIKSLSKNLGKKKSLAATYSSTLLCAVPSAMKGLTSEFGMGSGVSLSLLPPSKNLFKESYISSFVKTLTCKNQRLRASHFRVTTAT